jgi:DNA-binding NarL/FixJ family response regulator
MGKNMVTPEPKQIAVVICEDHASLREGLRLLLETEGDINVIAEAATGAEAVEKVASFRPEVVLMDVQLMGMDGIEATRQLHTQMPGVPVVVLSASHELSTVKAAVDAGAVGYLSKRASGKELRDAVRTAASGGTCFSPEVASAAKDKARQSERRIDDPRAVLTGRETEILQLIARGSSNREIAEALTISVKTVDTHRMHLMTKLDIHDVAGLTRYAIKKGLVE